MNVFLLRRLVHRDVRILDPAFFLYGPVLNDGDYILGSGTDTRMGAGAVLEILLAIAKHGPQGCVAAIPAYVSARGLSAHGAILIG